MALQKVFMLPPLKGLNLYDNPFTMSQEYAIELKNFMPPTTTFTVRPAVKALLKIEGEIKGFFSYNVGLSVDYGKYWYSATIKRGSANLIIVKVTNNKNKSDFRTIDLTNTPQFVAKGWAATGGEYTSDSALVNGSLFIATGSLTETCYFFSQKSGMLGLTLEGKDDGSLEISTMSNICIFNKFLFMASDTEMTLNYIQASDADIDTNDTWWRRLESLFTIRSLKQINLGAFLQDGGHVIRMGLIARSGSDTVSSYLSVVTSNGEILLFDGTDPSDATGEKWKLQGHFRIPPPINKECFCEMEGDVIVATKNGIISLKHVLFNHTSNITENLEFRMMSLFSQYMFRTPAMNKFISLNYFKRNRLLIFNVPTKMPIQLNNIMVGYTLTNDHYLVFPQSTVGSLQVESIVIDQYTEFVNKFVMPYYVSYAIYVIFNSDYVNSRLEISVTGAVSSSGSTKTGTITGRMLLVVNGVATDLHTPIIWTFGDPDSDNAVAVLQTSAANIVWNQAQFRIPEELTTTAIMPSNWVFYRKTYYQMIGDLEIGISMPTVQSFASYTKYYLGEGHSNAISFSDFFLNSGEHNFTTAQTVPSTFVEFPEYSDFYLNGDSNKISLFKLGVKAAKERVNEAGYFLPSSSIYITLSTRGILSYSLLSDPDSRVSFAKFTIECSYRIYGYVNTSHWGYTMIVPDLLVTVQFPTYVNTYSFSFTEQVVVGADPSKDVTLTPGCIKVMPPSFELINFSEKSGNFNTYLQSDFEWNIETNNEFFPLIDVTVGTGAGETPEVQAAVAAIGDKIKGYLVGQPFKKLAWYFDFFRLGNQDTSKEAEPQAPIERDNVTNFDLKALPILKDVSVKCNYGSTQYVFDSHFGTWSTFEDVNMLYGLEHDNNFYFSVPTNIELNADGSYKLSNSVFCMFEQNQMGDDNINALTMPRLAIQCSYKTVPTFDLGKPNKKIFKRLKMFGNPSVFWQPPQIQKTAPPMLVTPYVDFKEGKEIAFVHFDGLQTVAERVLKKHFKGRKFLSLNPPEIEKFWELYVSENDMIDDISVPVIARVGTRFGFKVELSLIMAYMSLFGIEVYFDESKQVL